MKQYKVYDDICHSAWKSKICLIWIFAPKIVQQIQSFEFVYQKNGQFD